MTDRDGADNEILETVRSAKKTAQAAAGAIDAARSRRWRIGGIGSVGLGVGIGSAAIAAAVIYARSGRKPD